MANNQAISFRLAHIKTEQFATFEDNYIPKEDLRTDFEVSYGIDTNKMAIRCLFGCKYFCKEEVVIVISVACFFQLTSVEWQKLSKGDDYLLPLGFVRHLAVITSGTVRGVLHSKTEGSVLNAFPLPLINLEEMIQEDILFKPESDNG